MTLTPGTDLSWMSTEEWRICAIPLFHTTGIPMIFICTCSQDGTTDLLTPILRHQGVFRFDIDRAESYAWDFCRSGFVITNLKTKESIDARSISSFYLRKPIYINPIDVPKDGCLENWCREETGALFEDFYHECEFRNQTALIHSGSKKYGKLRQLLLAERYFNVANWHFIHGTLPVELTCGMWVAKSLTGARIGKGKVFFVKEAVPAQLNLAYPWFLQKKIVGDEEVTVVYVNGKLFAYCYPRAAIDSCEDVRKATLDNASLWKPCELSGAEQSAIRGFMSETGYRFGRFDFIRKNGELWFLELNPNGQWAWLDEKNEDELITSIANEILAEDRCHQRATDLKRDD